MIIHSDFHDYYDTVKAWGVDETQRIQRFHKLTPLEGLRHERLRFSDGYLELDFFFMGYCGEWLPGIRIRDSKGVYRFVYSEEDIENISFESKDDFRTFYDPRPRWYARSLYQTCKVVFERGTFLYESQMPPEDLFYEYKCSLLTITYRNKEGFTLHEWPRLKDHDFMRIKDPFTVYQDICTYQFGVIGNTEDNTTTVPDEYLASAKGFDMEYGFRTRPKEKKK